ncbi:hypothetical protein HYU07_01495 [Candidatus Woesearchaeota archaeon]|nr:hypothetical protein [Candidatus Woesearchaeota archaeon]
MKKSFLLIVLFLLALSLTALPVLACAGMDNHSEAASGAPAATGMAVSDLGSSMMAGNSITAGYMGGYSSLYLIGQVLYLAVLVLIVYLLVKLIKKVK